VGHVFTLAAAAAAPSKPAAPVAAGGLFAELSKGSNITSGTALSFFHSFILSFFHSFILSFFHFLKFRALLVPCGLQACARWKSPR
jgi:hypothetical protein